MTWERDKSLHRLRLEQAERFLNEVLADPQILHRVRQSATRAKEQVEVAREQLELQAHPR
jgi:uncharacterized protein (UPF0147 family)